ncbi:hypothetical protein DPMN_025126 [Dreissena polymorpha]|uniref:Uncharacterized protein n=1 Tax=Dreissena polymorpha TaxID=45954 RepID=A0A9D4LQI6_DREPO|nr:hypothetical protein DPMN_025126 [Dreissena polymorpha]
MDWGTINCWVLWMKLKLLDLNPLPVLGSLWVLICIFPNGSVKVCCHCQEFKFRSPCTLAAHRPDVGL